MLDFSVLMQRLSQGQPPADMVLAVPPAAEAAAPEGPAASARPARAAGAPEPPAPVDPYQLADRVYQLMGDDLGIEHNRRAGR